MRKSRLLAEISIWMENQITAWEGDIVTIFLQLEPFTA
jgi:hypothetical protein